MTKANATENKHLENRVLVMMPTGRDSALVCQTLENAGIGAESCDDAADLEIKISVGAGAVLLAEEALGNGTLEKIIQSFERQPIWSDIPIVLFAASAQNSERLLEVVGTRLNATIVERPIRITMLVSAVRGALRARVRQYQARDLLNQLEETDHQKDLFLATLSHELRTPLNSMLGWIQLLRNEDSRDQVDANHALAVIERNAKTQADMIADILFVSRVITGKLTLDLEPIDLKEVFQSAIDTVRPSLDAKEINFHISFDKDLHQIVGDPIRLQQIFWNLLSNAIKFSSQKGQVEIFVKNNHSTVTIEMRDWGQGIKAEFLPFVFERFRQADSSYTRAIGGLGLGLAIVQHLVELHGGTVEVTSDGENQGALFTVTLPVSELSQDLQKFAGSDLAPLKKMKENDSLKQVCVLIVEDDEDSRELLKVVFEQVGIKTVAVDCAAAALQVIEETAPDILVSDVGLPGEDGYELMRKVRRLSAAQSGLVPAIALTGYASLEDRKLALDAGFQEHLTKPVDVDALIGLIKNLLGAKLENQ